MSRLACLRFSALGLFCWALGGCALLGGIKVEPVATSFQKPSNVAAYIAVSDGKEPIDELTADNFKIYENEQPIGAEASEQKLLDKDQVAYHHVLLLVDVSGQSEPSATESLQKGIANFVDKVRRSESVSVFAFDGRPGVRSIGEFSRQASGGAPEARALSGLDSQDSSRNLNGAVVDALKQLDEKLSASSKPVRVGTLVIFTRGADLAGRVSSDALHKALSDSKSDVLALGVAEEAGPTLGDLGKSGTLHAQSADSIPIGFEEIASQVVALYQKYYLLSYCSPARAGKRRLRVEVKYADVKGAEKHGDFTADFDASGFGPGCNPDTLPHFSGQSKSTASEATSAAKASAKSDSSSAKPAGKADKPSTSPPPSDDDNNVVPPPKKPGYSQ
ncbi:MAG TPA: hypothetical protein VGM29_05320 [Polyangiaceae bacterium]